MKIAGWGRYPVTDCHVIDAGDDADIANALIAPKTLIARGNGRSYGDSALNQEATLHFRRRGRLIAFDPTRGELTCEASTRLSDILTTFLPRGWFPPVTPGTKFVTIGGMIASDVHGKNHHHVGSFGRHLKSIDLMLASGEVITCSGTENPLLFQATQGGMGLTGIILRATFRLIPVKTSFIRQETLKADNLETVIELFEQSRDWTYSVAWIDCLTEGRQSGRSLLYRGEHASEEELSADDRRAPLQLPPPAHRAMPIDLPSFALNRMTARAFNELYYASGTVGTKIVDSDTFFYPLDKLLDWNRVYGKNGFMQFQYVLPKAASRDGLNLLLDRIRASNQGPFLAVLKLLGQGSSYLSFPMEGFTIAFDFPRRCTTLALMAELDAVMLDHGGRPYLAKDACATPKSLQFYPTLDAFKALKAEADPGHKFSSLQSRRLNL